MKFVERLFTNKMFLYVIVALTIITCLGYIAEKKFDSLLFLIAFGIIMKNFNKNMSVVLLASVFVTSLYTYIRENSLESMAGFRSRYKKNPETNKQDKVNKVEEYQNIKNTYNDLITTIKAKTAKIKEMTRKIKE